MPITFYDPYQAQRQQQQFMQELMQSFVLNRMQENLQAKRLENQEKQQAQAYEIELLKSGEWVPKAQNYKPAEGEEPPPEVNVNGRVFQKKRNAIQKLDLGDGATAILYGDKLIPMTYPGRQKELELKERELNMDEAYRRDKLGLDREELGVRERAANRSSMPSIKPQQTWVYHPGKNIKRKVWPRDVPKLLSEGWEEGLPATQGQQSLFGNPGPQATPAAPSGGIRKPIPKPQSGEEARAPVGYLKDKDGNPTNIPVYFVNGKYVTMGD